MISSGQLAMDVYTRPHMNTVNVDFSIYRNWNGESNQYFLFKLTL